MFTDVKLCYIIIFVTIFLANIWLLKTDTIMIVGDKRVSESSYLIYLFHS